MPKGDVAAAEGVGVCAYLISFSSSFFADGEEGETPGSAADSLESIANVKARPKYKEKAEEGEGF